MIHAKIWASQQFGELTPETQLLYIGTITLADDEGRLKGHPAYLRGQIFPYNEKLTIDDVRDLVLALEKAKLIEVYKVAGEFFIQHPKWNKYQKLRLDRMTASHIPAPEGFENEIDLLPNNANLPRALLLKVWERDGKKCRYCRKEKAPFHIDHIKPKSKGGKDTLSNLVVACEKCNTSKQDKDLNEFEGELQPEPTNDGQMTDKRPHKII
jgi:hypothetical protein